MVSVYVIEAQFYSSCFGVPLLRQPGRDQPTVSALDSSCCSVLRRFACQPHYSSRVLCSHLVNVGTWCTGCDRRHSDQSHNAP